MLLEAAVAAAVASVSHASETLEGASVASSKPPPVSVLVTTCVVAEVAETSLASELVEEALAAAAAERVDLVDKVDEEEDLELPAVAWTGEFSVVDLPLGTGAETPVNWEGTPDITAEGVGEAWTGESSVVADASAAVTGQMVVYTAETTVVILPTLHRDAVDAHEVMVDANVEKTVLVVSSTSTLVDVE